MLIIIYDMECVQLAMILWIVCRARLLVQIHALIMPTCDMTLSLKVSERPYSCHDMHQIYVIYIMSFWLITCQNDRSNLNPFVTYTLNVNKKTTPPKEKPIKSIHAMWCHSEYRIVVLMWVRNECGPFYLSSRVEIMRVQDPGSSPSLFLEADDRHRT